MGVGGVMLALTAVQAAMQRDAGYLTRAEANLNATIIEGKAGLIDVQKDMETAQYQKYANKMLASSYATAAASGYVPQGSFVDFVVNQQAAIMLDMTVNQLNRDREKRYVLEEAASERRRGKTAVYEGNAGAFSTILKGLGTYAMYKGLSYTSSKGVNWSKKTNFDKIMSKSPNKSGLTWGDH